MHGLNRKRQNSEGPRLNRDVVLAAQRQTIMRVLREDFSKQKPFTKVWSLEKEALSEE